jgi:hypothetical protein
MLPLVISLFKIDYEKYFRDLFSVFNLKDYQWQWVMSDSGKIIYDNAVIPVDYSGTEKLYTIL